MPLAVEISEIIQSRPCSFSLAIQDGSVFADFDKNDSDIISLNRVSFDGFGCCSVQGETTKMSPDDSRILLVAVADEHLNSRIIEDVLRRYFHNNSSVIWHDALSNHDLL